MRKPHAIFVLLAVLVGLAAFLNGDSTIEFPLFDYYYVIRKEYLAFALIVPFIIIGLMYFSFRRIQLVWWMTVLHIIGTAVPLCVIPFVNRSTLSSLFSSATVIFAAIFAVSQLIFWINLGISYSRRNR